MNVALSERAIASLASAPAPVQRAFLKQIAYRMRDFRHPPVRAKKYDEAAGVWQGRVNDDWRFYFSIESGVYFIRDVIPHPK